jgi:outer membrane receptor protein involved in Fe transport
MNQRMHSCFRLASYVLAVTALTLTAPVLAQQADRITIEEIVVTATKRAEAVQDAFAGRVGTQYRLYDPGRWH